MNAHSPRIGFEARPEQGPGIFLSRLRAELEKKGHFDAETPDVWIQLSFETLPEHIQKRKESGETRIVVRMDGGYCSKAYFFNPSFPLPVLDKWHTTRLNAKKNYRIRENLLAADHIVFQSEFSHRITQEFICPTPQGTIIPNGIDLEVFNPRGRKKPVLKNNRTQILMSHSFQPYHRLHDGLRVLYALRQESGWRFHLNILGGDHNGIFDETRRLAHLFGLEEDVDFTFHGKQPPDELPPFYRSCDVMLNLSYWDTCPNVVIEAMACGLPVVGVKFGGVAELVANGGTLIDEDIPFTVLDHMNPGRMVPAPVQTYAKAICGVIGQSQIHRRTARKHAESHFNIGIIADRYIDMARHMMEEQPSLHQKIAEAFDSPEQQEHQQEEQAEHHEESTFAKV